MGTYDVTFTGTIRVEATSPDEATSMAVGNLPGNVNVHVAEAFHVPYQAPPADQGFDLVKLVPLMDFLAGDGNDLITSFQSAFHLHADGTPTCHRHREGHYVPAIDHTMHTDIGGLPPHPVQMVEVIRDRWFDEGVSAYLIEDPHTGKPTLWVNAELVG